ncbi:ScyD/ScyE family protein [Kribbia dieselivorans]|uniref:ScyD/ScyE family protein n=1 Tax=Kribbia dieselivorans TaxID=331526 RepID=UPI000837E8D2|nr:ScyD/ScyE family protein [Kribbia dieselivorans]
MNPTKHRRTTMLLASALAASTATLGLIAATPATAKPQRPPVVLTTDVLAPFQIALNSHKVYATDGFAGTFGQVSPKGAAPLATGVPGIAGAEFTRDGRTYAYTSVNDEHTAGGLTIRAKGKADVFGDIAAHEASANPDQVNTYGIIAGSNPCAVAILGQLTGGEATYTGQLDTNPYAVARQGNHRHGRWLVADAGGNAVLAVSNTGKVSTALVLPPQPVTLTADMATALETEFGAPAGSMACLAGVTYAFEPVPTDVEVDQHGNLWISTLPGGPESPALGARGSVYKYSPRSGSLTKVATGFLGATDLAVHPDGTVYVTNLFGGKVSKVKNGKVSTAATIERPLAVEVKGGKLYVGQMGDIEFSESGPPVIHSPGSVQVLQR